MKKRVQIIVLGRVQGVGFRYFVQTEARKLGLVGFTQNLPDGTVEIITDATEEELKTLTAILKKGNGLSRVDKITTKEILKDKEFTNFQILR